MGRTASQPRISAPASIAARGGGESDGDDESEDNAIVTETIPVEISLGCLDLPPFELTGSCRPSRWAARCHCAGLEGYCEGRGEGLDEPHTLPAALHHRGCLLPRLSEPPSAC